MKNRIKIAVFLTCTLLGCVFATQLYWLHRMYIINIVQLEIFANRVFGEAINMEFTKRISSLQNWEPFKDEKNRQVFIDALETVNKMDTIIKVESIVNDSVYNIHLNYVFTDSTANWHERSVNIINHLIPPNYEQLDSIFAKLLHQEYPDVHSAIELTNLSGDTLIRTVSSGNVAIGRNELRTSLRPYDMYANTGIRGVIVSPQKVLLARTTFALVLSILFVGLTLACTGYLMHVIFKQNRYTQTVNDYIHHLTHQLKAPISVALTTLRFLDTDNSDNSQARHRLVELSEQSLAKLTSMIESLLFMSVQEQSHLRLNVEPFDLPAAICRLAGEAELNAGKEAHIVVDNQLPDCMVTADRLHLCDAVNNLIDNAIKYSGNPVDIHIRLNAKPGYICISVKDNGIGIAPEHVGRIFDKFYRIDQPQTNSVKGFGLGLSYVQAVCRAHSGHVEVISKTGQGSEFTITINCE